MELNKKAKIYIPDKKDLNLALSRTTTLAISAHQDDIEFFALPAIASCYENPKEWFSAVVTTDGAGSPRGGKYADYSDFSIKNIRIKEQNKAAKIGKYSCVIHLSHPSTQTKDNTDCEIVEEFLNILNATTPTTVFTHNLCDRHATHVAVGVKVIEAIRKMDKSTRPQKVYGGEVWRDLDWLSEEDKVVFDISNAQNLGRKLIKCFDSQIAGGKSYDEAFFGRTKANATFSHSHDVDNASALSYCMDLTPLIQNDELNIKEFITKKIEKFQNQVTSLIK